MNLSRLKYHYQRFVETGITPLTPPNTRTSIIVTNQVAVFTMTFAVIYALLAYLLNFERSEHFELFHIGLICAYIPVYLFNKYGWHLAASVTVTLAIYSLITLNSFLLHEPYRTDIYLFALGGFVFVVFNNTWLIFCIYVILTLTFYLLAVNAIGNHPELIQIKAGLLLRSTIAFSLLFIALNSLRQESKKYRRKLEAKTVQLTRSLDNLEKLNFSKDKIFSIISHDLRSPINSLKAMLGLVASQDLSEQEFKKMVGSLEVQVNQLHESLNEMLQWSKSQMQGLDPKPRLFKLRTLIHEIVNVNKVGARRKKIILTSHVASHFKVYADRDMIKSVVHNMVTNAIKFTPTGGAISIECHEELDCVVLLIEDTGVGIGENDLKLILDKNTHYTTAGTNNEKGTGLGLIMSKEFIEKNNGTLEIISKPRRGSLFKISLPKEEF